MTDATGFLLGLGGILLLGLATDWIGKRTFLPRITLLLVFGIFIGEQGFDLIPSVFSDRFEIIADMTLLVIGFLLGGMLTPDTLQKSGKAILSISLFTAVLTTAVVTTGLLLIGVSIELALILGCIASATAPASTVDSVIESGNHSTFSRLLLSIVALDDAWGLILFSLCLALISTINGNQDIAQFFIHFLRDIGGAVLLGLIIGLPSAYLTGRIKPGQLMLSEALGVIFLCGGLSLWLDFSFLIAAITLGATIANFAKHHEYPFQSIEVIEWPLLSIFFVLAGASLEFNALTSLGLIGIGYVVFRTVGKIVGAYLGASIGKAEPSVQRWMGIAMLPQAGAALGMALVAANQFPELRQPLLSVVIASTVFFELIGPIGTRIALNKASTKI